MPSSSPRKAPSARRRSLCLGHVNGVLWAIGNALTSGTLLVYLAQDMGAQGLALSLILAAPSLSGVLRIFTPWMIQAAGGVKKACVLPFLGSYLLLWGQPFLGLPVVSQRSWALPALVSIVCLHQLLEYVGQACLWAWFGELAPRRLRGRYFARRQVLQLAVVIPSLLASGWYADRWRNDVHVQVEPSRAMLGYVIPAAVGTVFLMASLVPLTRLPDVAMDRAGDRLSLAAIVAPWRDGRFRRLMLFGCWVAMANGVTQAAQNIYPKKVLGLGVLPMATFRTTMQIGQIGYSHWAGGFSDLFGNRPVMILSQFLVALGPLFFLAASPPHPWWLWGAWACWSAFAGLNVCLPSFMLKVSTRHEHAAYIATYFGVTNVVYAACTVGGGALHAHWSAHGASWRLGDQLWDYFAVQFAAGALLRAVGAVLLLRLIEPGAWRWSAIASVYLCRGGSADRVAHSRGAE